MNPPTRLQKKKKKKHRSLLLFHILQFPRKQSHPSCWLDGETKLKVDLFPPPPPPATALDCSRRTNNNSQLRPSRVPSTGAVIYSALSEHKRAYSARSRLRHPCTSRHCGKMKTSRERESLPFFPSHRRSLPPSLFSALSCLLSRSRCIPISLSFFPPPLPPRPTILSHRLFPLADRLPATSLPLQPQTPRNMTERLITHTRSFFFHRSKVACE